MTQATVITYSKKEVVRHFFSTTCPIGDNFILLPGESEYRLGEWDEQELEKMMSRKQITNYITFEHILSIISEFDNFLTPAQLKRIADEIEDFE